MANAFFTLALVLASINIILFLSGVRVLDDGSESNFLSSFIETNENETLQTSTDFDESIPNTFQRTGATTIALVFIDPIGTIIKGITFLINIVFTPLGLIGDLGFPVILQWMIGVPLMIVALLGLLFFIRGVGN